MRRVLLVSGSTRALSTNTAFVRTAALCAPPSVETFRHGLTALPHFNPDDDREPLPPSVAALRAGIAAADGVLICTPEYAGTIPGALKNLLEWTVGGTEMTDRPTAWVNVASDPRRGHGAIDTLRTVLGYVQARIVEDACRSIPISSADVGPDGVVADPGIRAAITDVLTALVA
ncbi:NADPH-dependent FMN reductase [Jatrophihabitans fulvus]